VLCRVVCPVVVVVVMGMLRGYIRESIGKGRLGLGERLERVNESVKGSFSSCELWGKKIKF
jgi:hypothetical protein